MEANISFEKIVELFNTQTRLITEYFKYRDGFEMIEQKFNELKEELEDAGKQGEQRKQDRVHRSRNSTSQDG